VGTFVGEADELAVDVGDHYLLAVYLDDRHLARGNTGCAGYSLEVGHRCLLAINILRP
jgi:hypothetical protein